MAAASSVAIAVAKFTVTSPLGTTCVLLTAPEPSETVPDVNSETAIANVPMIKAAPISLERRLGGGGGSLSRSAAVRREADIECMDVPRKNLAQELEGGLIVYYGAATR